MDRLNLLRRPRSTYWTLLSAAFLLIGIAASKHFLQIIQGRGWQAPGDFKVEATGTGPRSALIVVFLPEETNDGLHKCYGEIRGSQGDRHSFSCDHHTGRSSTVLLNGLQPGTTYYGNVTFADVLENEEAATRRDFVLKTSITAPGEFKVQATATGPTSALIVVFVPEKRNGDLDKCYGEMRSPLGDRYTFSCNNHGGRASTIELDQLERGREYTGAVTFANVQDSEEAATEKRFTLMTHSGAPGDFDVEVTVTGTSSAVIVVYVPKEKNGPLDKCYGEIKSPHGDSRSFSCKDHSGRSSTITLSTLRPGTEYSVVVTFANVHEGKDAATQKKFTLKTHSSAPGDFVVEAKATGTSSLELLVFAPKEPNGALDDCYGVLFGPSGVEHHFTCNDHGGRSSTVTLGGLQPGTMYQGEVTFVNIHEGRKMATQKAVSIETYCSWTRTEVVLLVTFIFCVLFLICSCRDQSRHHRPALGKLKG